jgi:hypothetical protein
VTVAADRPGLVAHTHVDCGRRADVDALVVDGHPLRIDRPLVEFRINNPEPLLACTIQVGRSERAGRTSFDVRYAPTRGVMIGHPDLRSLTRRNPVTGRFNPSLDRNELREALGPTLLVAWELLAELAHGIFPLPGFRLPRNKVRLKYIDLQRRYWHNEPEGADCQLHLWREVSPGMWGPVDRYYDESASTSTQPARFLSTTAGSHSISTAHSVG